MSDAKTVMKWVKSNDFFEGNVVEDNGDVFVPYKNNYPHIHINKDFVTYSKSSSNHAYLIQGDQAYKERTETAKQDCGNADIMQICSYILSRFCD